MLAPRLARTILWALFVPLALLGLAAAAGRGGRAARSP
jgi:hypothetical protein